MTRPTPRQYILPDQVVKELHHRLRAKEDRIRALEATIDDLRRDIIRRMSEEVCCNCVD